MTDGSTIFCGRKTWLEGPAVEQFERVLTFPGILRGAAFPDLHPGRGVPVGAAFLAREVIYPALIGNDIGCGMTLFSLGCTEHKFKKDKLFRRLGCTKLTYLDYLLLFGLFVINSLSAFFLDENLSDLEGHEGGAT